MFKYSSFRLDLDRFDNDVYDHIDMNGQIVDNNPKQTTNKQELEALDELKSECNTRYDSTFSNAWRKVNFHNGINVLNNFISSGQDDKEFVHFKFNNKFIRLGRYPKFYNHDFSNDNLKTLGTLITF